MRLGWEVGVRPRTVVDRNLGGSDFILRVRGEALSVEQSYWILAMRKTDERGRHGRQGNG